jgi:hypothetical protein
MTGERPTPVRSAEELTEQAGDWGLLAKLLEPPRAEWRQQLLDASADTIDPELEVAVKMAQREGHEYYHQCLFGPDGLLTSRESEHRFERDRGAVIADLHGLSEALGYSRIGPEPADHIVALVGLMAHVTTLEAEAISEHRIGEAMYLEGVAEWLRRGHLAWFADQITRALLETEVCYLSHVAYALEARVLPPWKNATPAPRPSDNAQNE